MTPLARALLAEIAADPAALAELAQALEPFLPQPAAHEDDRWMTTREAALYLGLSVNAIKKKIAARAIPFEQDAPGGKCYFKCSESMLGATAAARKRA